MTAQPASFRKATSADIPALQRLYRELDRHHVDLLPAMFQIVEGNVRSDETLASWLTAEDRFVLLAEIGCEIVGFVDAAIKESPPFPILVPRKFGLVEHIYVTPAHRNKGLGMRLTQDALAWFRTRDIGSVEVGVWNNNATTYDFYRRAGFTPACTRMELSLGKQE